MYSNYIKELSPLVSEIITHSQNLSVRGADSTKLLEKWAAAKKDIIRGMGGNLIIESENVVYFKLGPEEKRARFNRVADTIESEFNHQDIAEFMDHCGIDGFFSNINPEPYSSGTVRIPKGIKMVKAFKYFESDKAILTKMQDYVSTAIQEDTISGKLCMSVHPLDFLSSSENTYKWRTCHSLDGDYRAGNLSYMCDPTTIMFYLKGADDVVLPHFPENIKWNSKKWRMLLYISELRDIMFAGRQYPIFSKDALRIIESFIVYRTDVMRNYHIGNPWRNDRMTAYTYNDGGLTYLRGGYIPMDHRLIEMDQLVVDRGEPPVHFNDLLYSSCYVPYYTYSAYGIKQNDNITIGCDAIPCPVCGEIINNSSEHMVCYSCSEKYEEFYGRCDCCNRHVHHEDDLYYVDDIDEHFCGECIDEYCAVCSECGSVCLREHMSYTGNGYWVCDNCNS